MRLVLQRVLEASLKIDGEPHASIGAGWVVLLGIGPNDKESDQLWAVDKILNLRAFGDGVERSVTDSNGSLLIVSQFTLYADCRRGRRPGFSGAAAPNVAKVIYQEFVERLIASTSLVVKTGVFAANMQVQLINDGPYTLFLDSEQDRKHD